MSDSRVGISEGDANDALLRRRTMLRGVAAGSVGIAALTACGSDDGDDASTSQGGYGGSDQTSDSGGDDSGGSDGGADEGGGTPLGPTSEVPVGGGVVYGDQEVVVTQPTEGEFLGFTAICTHQGCTVGEVADGTINCPCHGSKFAIEDGSVVNGPAASPLDSANVSVKGQQVMLG